MNRNQNTIENEGQLTPDEEEELGRLARRKDSQFLVGVVFVILVLVVFAIFFLFGKKL